MHNIQTATYPENVNRNEVQAEWDEYVAHEDWQEGASGLDKPIRWIDHVCDSREEAEKYIEEHDSGWYDQLAVKFRVPDDSMKKTTRWKFLSEKVAEWSTKFAKRSNEVYPSTLTSKFIACKKCGSSLAREKLRSNSCPVCHNDLRTTSILESIETAQRNMNEAKDRLRAYEEDYAKNHKNKAKIKWLVKIEYHT